MNSKVFMNENTKPSSIMIITLSSPVPPEAHQPEILTPPTSEILMTEILIPPTSEI